MWVICGFQKYDQGFSRGKVLHYFKLLTVDTTTCMVSFIMPPCPFLKEDLVGKRYGCLPLPLVLLIVVNQSLFTTVLVALSYPTEMSKFLPPEFAGQLAKGCMTKAKEYRKKAERHLRMAEFMEACSAGVNVA